MAIKAFTDEQHKKAVAVHKMPVGEQAAKYDKLAVENDEFLKSKLSATQNKKAPSNCHAKSGITVGGRCQRSRRN